MKKILFVLALGIAFTSCQKQKTAYVDNTRLIQDYQAMMDVEADFEKKSTSLRAELDSIATQFQSQVQAYQVASEKMSAAERQQAETQLMQMQQRLQQEQQNKTSVLREESGVVIDSLIEDVKDFVANYGKENNYTYIFGSNETANIMYAEEGLDITDEILKELNATYEKE